MAGAVTFAAALLATACSSTEPGTGASRTTPVDLGNIKLVSYSGCDDMLAGLRTATAKSVGPWGIGGPMIMYMDARPAARAEAGAAKGVADAPDHSTTNVHEAGVDEPDLVKTDGNRVITVNRGVLRVVDAATRKVTGTLRLVDAEQAWAPADLLISGDRALVLFSGGGIIPYGAMAKRPASSGPRYVLVDLSGAPKVIGSLTPNGAHVDARLVGSTVRIVVRSQPEINFPDAGPDLSENERTRRNMDVVAKTPIEAWLPTFEVTAADGTTSKKSVGCEQISHPAEYTGTSMLTVHSLDLSPGVAGISATTPISVAADGDTVYGTGSSLYVTSNPRWWWPRPIEPTSHRRPSSPRRRLPKATPAAPQSEPTPPEPSVTVSPAVPAPPPSRRPWCPRPQPIPSPQDAGRAAGGDRGPPVRHHRRRARPATSPRARCRAGCSTSTRCRSTRGTCGSPPRSTARAGATPAAPVERRVRARAPAPLNQVGEVGGLGEGERIYSVRFVGPVGYVVTFRQVDPLYTLDLRDPAAPRTTGELKITGYSAYLHPAGDGR